ncbi:beta-ketoacyl synthase N-terminal-like domain-containing protein [Streptomyces sp. Je 1-369]|uniref:beta-ketoacyl synthase N-terminal-like domain-containing protein n=1 Tax=Streptomyces sp. Je 1-369 TaxID=2966192 RepID=UPI00228554EA|nr:beta-ketoacyl synthase N-terminal-like domain-containing protein [Streptomyces sp. Je 1-369]WAL97012.1 acyltransferase domain-containing protein [Streptomyces sp. Je 1-369]
MSDRVAVVGMSIRAANVRNTADFWRLISTGRSGRQEISPEDLARRGVPERRYKNPAYVPVEFPMADALACDLRAFGFTRTEAELTDPQHRVMLEACYRAVESSGCFIGSLPDRVGVFLGSRTTDYGARIEYRSAAADRDLDTAGLAIGTDPDYMSSRISYAYGLTGPSMTVLTACSSSSVAVHLACQAILAGECDAALAGGVAVNVRDAGYLFAENGIYSPRGRCEPYTTAADGTVDGNGVAVLFLRRLDAALAAGNPILGVVAGTAVNNDGRERAGFTAPGVAGQTELVEEALDVAELSASAIGLLEGHGSGTRIGDALEIEAATQAFRSSGAEAGKCRLHSVKANIGNLTAAAGAAGIIGSLLALRHGEIPPNAPLVAGGTPTDLRGTPFSLADRPTPWPRSDRGRYAAVSSFGLGGTNAHVVIGDAEREVRLAERKGRSWQLLPLSADDPERLAATVDAARGTVAGATADTRRDIGHTLRTGRPQLTTRATALIPVDGSAADVRWPARERFHAAPEGPPALVFMLPGDDVPAPDAARALYEAEPVFRATVDDGLAVMEEVLAPEAFAAVRDAFRRGASRQDGLADTPLTTRPVLHLLATGQHAFLADLGIGPDLLVGHGVGELTAARLSGVLSSEDAARAVCRRAQTLADAHEGAEAAVRFTRQMREVRLHAPTTPTLSAATGTWLTAEEACDPGYWGAQPGEPAAPDDAVRTLAVEHPGAVCLQLGGGTSLLRAARLAGAAEDTTLAVLPEGEAAPGHSLLRTVGDLWERGIRIDWDAYAERDHARRIDTLPREFDRTPCLHPVLQDHGPGTDPAERTGKQVGR